MGSLLRVSLFFVDDPPMKIPEQIYVKSVLRFLNCNVTLHVFPWVFPYVLIP